MTLTAGCTLSAWASATPFSITHLSVVSAAQAERRFVSFIHPFNRSNVHCSHHEQLVDFMQETVYKISITEVITMKAIRGAMLCCIMLAVSALNAHAVLVTLSEQDKQDAIKQGREQGKQVISYVKQRYRFGEENSFRENGIIRTAWSKLMILSGLLAEKGEQPQAPDMERILASAELQIDIHTYGDRIDFANNYRAYLMQGGKRIEPATLGVDHPRYLSGKEAAGFPRYHATIRSYFAYEKISPQDTAEVVLVKDGTEVRFKVNLADYR
jgi:hypothetical protein